MLCKEYNEDLCSKGGKYRRGLCQLHSQRKQKGTPADAPKWTRRGRLAKPKGPCKSYNPEICSKTGRQRSGLCPLHYNRARKGMPMDSPKREHRRGNGFGAHRPGWSVADYNRRLKYNLTPEDYAALGKTCHICGRVPPKPCVDHDHVTGKVRGLLCSGCNAGMGKLGDNIEGLLRAVKYLRKHEEETCQESQLVLEA